MSGDQESVLPSRTKPIFPLTNRRAPVLDRIRERRRRANSIGFSVGKEIAELSVLEDDEEQMEEATKIRMEFREGLASGFGVDEDQISNDLVNEFAAMFTLSEDEVVSEKEEIEEDKAEEDEVDEDAEDIFG